jgi:predicted small lipoprotein YifL
MRTSFDFPMKRSSMSRWLARGIVPAITLVTVLSLAGCGAPGTFTLPDDPMVGKPSPYFSFHSVHKRAFPSTNFQGKTLVMVFIRPGQPEVPILLQELEKLHRNPVYSAVQFVVMSPETDPLTEPFWVGLENSLPIALDFTDVAGKFGASALPMIVVTDYKGVIRMRLDGYLGDQFQPRFEATRKLIRQVEEDRSRPTAAR